MKKTIEKIPKILSVLLFFVLLSFSAMAQNLITGKVTDSKTGEGAPGVTVTIKGTRTSTQTGTDGTFKISAPSASATLVFSSVGYSSQETSANAGSAVSIALVERNQQLNEVVVVGYGTARKKDLTGAVTLVTSKDFVKGSITTPEQLISGKVAGVSIISNGGQPGSGSTIRIRGGASLNASNDPLIIIDGIPLENAGISGAANALALINPNDIESFNVLKDASSAAIYGSRASNGVIIITTKRGTAGKTKINFNTNLSAGRITDKVDVMSASQLRDYVNANGTDAQKELLGTANTDWQDEIYRTAISTDNNISISGTKNKMPYRLSAGYLNQNGILKRDNLDRWSMGVNLSPRFLNNNLKVDINIKASQTNNHFANQGAIGAAVTFDPTKPVKVDSKKYAGYYEWLSADPTSQTGLLALSPRNPVGLLESDHNTSVVKRSISNIVLDYKLPFFPALRANLNIGYDYAKGFGRNYTDTNFAVTYHNYKDLGGILHSGSRSQYAQRRKNSLLEFYLGYTKEYAAIKSRVELIAGYSYNDFLTRTYNYSPTSFDGAINPSTAATFAFGDQRNTIISTYARLNYSLLNRYLLQASIRRDGSSRFINKHRYGTFPTLALAWRVKEESFLKNSRTFSDFKIRAGYGETGQQDGIGNYDYGSFYTLGNNAALYQLGNTFYQINKPSAYYPERRWEQTAATNIGLDLGLFDSRVTITADAYIKKTTYLLNEITQPAGVNFSNKIVANVGDMENKGVEVTVGVELIKKKDLTWNISVNGTYNKNEITKLTISEDPKFQGNQLGGISIGTGSTLFINTVDYPRYNFYVYKQVYDQNGKPIDGLFEDINRDGKINSDDLYRYKNPDPKAFFGFSTDVSYKKFNAGFVMRAQLDNYIYNQVNAGIGTRTTVFGNGYLNNAYSDFLNTKMSGTQSGYYLSDYYIQNASFLRMDNINLGYNIGAICHGTSNLRLNFNVQNVFVITKYKGLDPEISSGIDNNFYPRPRTYVLGLNLDF